MSKTFASQVVAFNESLAPNFKMPDQVELMNPFLNSVTRELSAKFYKKYYSDDRKRIYVFGINPGRFGAGVTGVPFTDPVKLEEDCGITNDLDKRAELSSDFIYRMIHAYGGPDAYYEKYFITGVCPLGFVRNNKNLNYYDDKQLIKAVEPFILETIRQQLDFGCVRSVALCLGEGLNYKYMQKVNQQHQFFEKIVPLAHPRFILQYRRKQLQEYLNKYMIAYQEAEQFL